MPADTLHSLLVPIDLSPHSDRVVRRAASLPVAAGATITLLHVIPKALPALTRRRAEKDARTALAPETAFLSKALRSDISIEHEVSVGAPAAEIAERAARLKADLIVLGRGVGRPVRDSFLGSTAERVIRQTRMPVLPVRSTVRGPYRRPTLGLDVDAAAEPLLAMLFRVIAPPRPRVTIVHAHDAPYARLRRLLESGLNSQVGDPGWCRIWIDDGPPEIRGHVALRAHSEQPAAHRALLSIGVLEPYRRAGIALRLMQAMIGWATRHDLLDWIDSEVFGHNEPALNLHRRVGFVEAGRVRDMFRLDGRSVDDVRLVLALNRAR